MRRASGRACALALACALAGCAAEANRSVFQAAQPIPHRARAEAGTVLPLSLEDVAIDLPYGRRVGARHDGSAARGWDYEWGTTLKLSSAPLAAAAVGELDKAGLLPQAPVGIVTGPAEPPPARFALTAVLKVLELETFGPRAGNYSLANLTVEWRLQDKELRRQVWAKPSYAGATVEGVHSSVVIEAFRKAAQAVATDPDLVAALRVDPTLLRSPIGGEPLPEARKLQTAHAFSDELWAAQESVVALRHGDGYFSGFFISTDGLIVASHQPAVGRRRVEITLKNGSTLPADVLRVDPVAGISLLRASGRGFTPLPLGDAERLDAGAQVYLIAGAAFRENAASVLRGNYRGPRLASGRQYFLTDAPRVEGSIGAPVLDLAGNVVALLAAGSARSGSETLSLAVPVELIKDEVRTLGGLDIIAPRP